jgi:hypothetical protein
MCIVKLSVQENSLVPISYQHLGWKSVPDTAYKVEQGTSWIRVKDWAEHEQEKLCYDRNFFTHPLLMPHEASVFLGMHFGRR